MPRPISARTIRWRSLEPGKSECKPGLTNYGVAVIKEKAPDLDFGVAFLPGPRRGEVSSFAGGDVLAIPAAAKHAAKAVEFLNWVLGDEPQLEVYAKSGNMP